jgi:hypothetical protein
MIGKISKKFGVGFERKPAVFIRVPLGWAETFVK